MNERQALFSRIYELGIDVAGVADLDELKGIPSGLTVERESFLSPYKSAVVLGAPMGSCGPDATGDDVSLFLEKAALVLAGYIHEKKGYKALIIHTEDEFDPEQRIGLFSLKALAKGAGLGWQGRSLLIVSPDFGPLHRLIAILTDMPLEPDQHLRNRCDECRLCVEHCPGGALSYVQFEDHPETREEVLNLQLCLGDEGCMVCLEVCPWIR
jgi:epoxyqueuosine reductase QueG